MAIEDIQSGLDKIKNDIATTGIQDSAGNTLVAPTSVLPMKSTTSVVPNLSSVSGDIAKTNTSIENYFKSKAEKAAEEKATAEKVQSTKPSSWLSWLSSTGQQTPTQYAQEQYSNLGYDTTEYFNSLKADTAEIETLNEDLNSTIAARDQELNNIEGRAIPMSEIIGAQSVANRNWNIRITEKESNINAKAALLEAKQGNFETAQNFVNNAVSAYTSQLNTDLEMVMSFYDDNAELIKSLGEEYDSSMTNYISTLESELETKKEEKTNVLSLMIENPNAGITVNDTVESASQKIAKSGGTSAYQLQLAQENRLARESTTGTGLSASLQSDYAEDLAYIDSLSGEEQTNWLTQNKRALIAKYGEENYNNMLPQLLITKTTTTPITTPSFSSENYKDAGNGMVFTPDGRIINKSQISSDIQKNTPNFVSSTSDKTTSWWSKLFGGTDLSSVGITTK